MTREAKTAYYQQWKEQNRSKLKDYYRARYLRNKVETLAEGHQRYGSNKAEILAKQKRYYELNRARILERQRVYIAQHKQQNLRRALAYAKAHPDRVRAYKKKYQDAHKAENLLRTKARRCRIRSSENDLTLVGKFYSQLRKRAWVNCYYCGACIRGKDAHVDHVVSLAKGGNHAVENLAACCRSCNQSKGPKLPHEWSRHPQMFLTL